jgi:hypothetical protein
MSSKQPAETTETRPAFPEDPSKPPDCRLNLAALEIEGEVRCPVCHHVVPPEQIGYKLHCRRCGYLESCCNPIQSSL